MARRSVHLRSLAASDIDRAVAHLLDEAGQTLALEFVDALERSVEQIRRAPHLGSLWYSYELGIPELRVWHVKRFAYLTFYVPSGERLDVWRVLHSRRDIPGAFVLTE